MKHSRVNNCVAHRYARSHCGPRRGENFIILCGMESTYPAAYRRVVVSGSKDPVEYFVRAKDDGRTVVPTQTETRTGWFMCPVRLRSIASLDTCRAGGSPVFVGFTANPLAYCEGHSRAFVL
ncbi:hypothetical protein TcCL_Unassigned04533 [Trypanosoma cruzi]|nr:hypothetical protein TcCL_Unassigned04533 [Trypanosoma cruzi]